MNHAVTSKEVLVESAKKIAETEGFDKISIRRLAKECQVAVGSIYNYFPTKKELMDAVIENFWQNAVHGIDWQEVKTGGMIECVDYVYHKLYLFLQNVEENGNIPLSSLHAEAYFQHMKQELLYFLKSDDKVNSSVFCDCFSEENLIQFLFEHMMILIKNQQEHCDFLLEVMKRLLYQEV